MLLNLVTNAEQALAGQPRKEVTISASRTSESIRIVVADTGSGMESATQDRVFELFFTTKQGQGTGLGLSLSYSIIQSHGGQLTVESAIGKGTRFTITLPLSTSGDLPAAESFVPEPLRAARVLVVDDEPSLRKVCQRLIASMGHECETAENTATALALAAEIDFDVVLCDYRLATETADQVIDGFARMAPHLVPRTIIATGATTDAGVVDLTARYGLRLIAKPYGAEELLRLIAPAS